MWGIKQKTIPEHGIEVENETAGKLEEILAILGCKEPLHIVESLTPEKTALVVFDGVFSGKSNEEIRMDLARSTAEMQSAQPRPKESNITDTVVTEIILGKLGCANPAHIMNALSPEEISVILCNAVLSGESNEEIRMDIARAQAENPKLNIGRKTELQSVFRPIYPFRVSIVNNAV
jgi:hypothetical protein